MRKIYFICLTFTIIALNSCLGGRSEDDILSHQEMEDILYDYHVAQALVSQTGDSVDYRIRLYAQAIFKKHKVSEEQFDKSLRYYHRNANELHEIYRPLSERLSQSIGSTTEPQYTSEGDTANIWSGKDYYLLSVADKNYFSIKLPADTILTKGDKLEWSFTPSWLYKEGKRDAIAILAIEYEGDTVVSTTHHISSSGPQQLTMRIEDKKMSAICIYALLNSPWSNSPKHLLLSDISLIRYHSQTNQPKTTPTSPKAPDLIADTTKHTIKKDSVKRGHKVDKEMLDDKQPDVATPKTFHFGNQR